MYVYCIPAPVLFDNTWTLLFDCFVTDGLRIDHSSQGLVVLHYELCRALDALKNTH